MGMVAMSDDLRDRLTDRIAQLWIPRVKAVDGVVHIPAESMADALLPFIQEEIDDAVKAEYWRWRARALPDRWISLRRVDFINLVEVYRNRREVHREDHDTALEYVLAEIEYEPNQEDLDEESYHSNTP